jgi:RNA recognition motif-containing protein
VERIPRCAGEPLPRGEALGSALACSSKRDSGRDRVKNFPRVKRRIMVTKKLYVGNLDYKVSSADLERLFTGHGTVESATVIADRSTGQSKGFGFVEMSSGAEAQAAITTLDGHSVGERALKVNEARPRPSREGGHSQQW